MQSRITVNGQDYQIPQERLGELLQWLSQNSVRTQTPQQRVNEVIDTQFSGSSLIEG